MSIETIRESWKKAQAAITEAQANPNHSKFAIDRMTTDIRKAARDAINKQGASMVKSADSKIAAASDGRRKAMQAYRQSYDSGAALLADGRMSRLYQSADVSVIWSHIDVAARDGDLITLESARAVLPELVGRARRDGLSSPVGQALSQIESTIDSHLDSMEPASLRESAQAIEDANQSKEELLRSLNSVQFEMTGEFQRANAELPLVDVLSQRVDIWGPSTMEAIVERPRPAAGVFERQTA